MKKNLLYLMQKIPSVKLVQTYGMSEIGILATDVYEQKPWLTRPQKRLNDFFLEGNELVVKSKSMMLGYINYSNDSNVTIIGNEIWFKTQDVVEVEDDFYRILGRNSDVINIGGFKYFPFELEEKIMTLEGVENITVLAERSEFLGVVVIGQVVLAENISELDFQIRFKKFSEENLPPYMRLHKIEFLKTPEVNFRSKKVRIR